MAMKAPERVAHYVSELAGARSEDAWHSLAEMGPAVLPLIIQAFEKARDKSVAVDLIRVVNEYRTHAALPFLMNLLRTDDPVIWKTALDGIVAAAGSDSSRLLREMCQRVDLERRAWLEEAIEELGAGDG